MSSVVWVMHPLDVVAGVLVLAAFALLAILAILSVVDSCGGTWRNR